MNERETTIMETPPSEQGLRMQWRDAGLRDMYLANLTRLRENQRLHPDLYGPLALPFKVIDPDSVGPVKRMRLIWLQDNHPQALLELEMSDTLEQHLKDTERLFLSRRAQLTEQLMESRHLLQRTDIMQAHPEITDQDRYHGMLQAQNDAHWMAIHEIIESF